MRWILGSAVLLAIALAFGLGLMVYAMYALIAVILGSRLLVRYWLMHLTGTRHVSKLDVEEDDEIVVGITLRYTGAIPMPWLLVEDLLPRHAIITRPPALEVVGRRLFLAMLWPRSTRLLNYRIKCNRRGYYQIGPAVLETGDVFGLYKQFKMIAEPEFITVEPAILPLEGFDLVSKRPLGEIKMQSRLFEDPSRIAGVRRYQLGDPLNRIHWASTARTGELHSKQYEATCIAGVSIILDLHPDSFPERDEPIRSELAIKCAVAIANAVQLMDQQVGIVTNSVDAAERMKYEGWDFDARTRDAARKSAGRVDKDPRLTPQKVRTRRGAEQFQQIRHMMARSEKNEGLHLPSLILEMQSELPRDATVIPILTKVTPEVALALGNLVRSGYVVTPIVNLFDEYEYAQAAGMLLAERMVAKQLKSLETISQICQEQAYPLF
ncbi:DUF58 domain-containing protein [Blastopirellula marina]|uniref:DUF58 domain-containing protein n=1 Tax=Blastopirellula marina TaxID=124 RepID=A0A2S8GDL3_9BACT|nr:DUF58 domain-containing protein [Blastopirellula marina]PQO42331.1 DUF58 domain-containing protein [Blastopirellula marina]